VHRKGSSRESWVMGQLTGVKLVMIINTSHYASSQIVTQWLHSKLLLVKVVDGWRGGLYCTVLQGPMSVLLTHVDKLIPFWWAKSQHPGPPAFSTALDWTIANVNRDDTSTTGGNSRTNVSASGSICLEFVTAYMSVFCRDGCMQFLLRQATARIQTEPTQTIPELWHCLILLGVLEVFWFYAALIIFVDNNNAWQHPHSRR